MKGTAAMLKFRCQHCGQRIAVGPRHLGKLVTCPECGQPTHPLAEQIVSLQGAPSPDVAPHGRVTDARPGPAARSIEPEEHCANCGDAVGRLQKRNLWQDHLVCTACHGKLSGENADEEVVAGEARPGKASRRSAVEPQRVAARRAGEEWAEPAAGLLLARGAATAGRLVLAAGALASGALAKASVSSGVPAVIDRHGDPGTPEPGASLRDAPLPLHTRLMIILAVVCLAGAGVYGALTLLRDLAGYLTSAAFIVLAVAGGYLLLRLSLSAGRKLFPLRLATGGRPGAAAARSRRT